MQELNYLPGFLRSVRFFPDKSLRRHRQILPKLFVSNSEVCSGRFLRTNGQFLPTWTVRPPRLGIATTPRRPSFAFHGGKTARSRPQLRASPDSTGSRAAGSTPIPRCVKCRTPISRVHPRKTVSLLARVCLSLRAATLPCLRKYLSSFSIQNPQEQYMRVLSLPAIAFLLCRAASNIRPGSPDALPTG